MITDWQDNADQAEELSALAEQERMESERPHPNRQVTEYIRDAAGAEWPDIEGPGCYRASRIPTVGEIAALLERAR